MCRMPLFWPQCRSAVTEGQYPRTGTWGQAAHHRLALSPPVSLPEAFPVPFPTSASSFFMSILIYHAEYLGWHGARYLGSRTTSYIFFPKVSTVLQGRILIWCYMDPGGCVRLQTQLHLPQLQGFSEQVGGLRSINRVYRSTLQFMERGGTKHTATVYSGNLLEPQGPALLTS